LGVISLAKSQETCETFYVDKDMFKAVKRHMLNNNGVAMMAEIFKWGIVRESKYICIPRGTANISNIQATFIFSSS